MTKLKICVTNREQDREIECELNKERGQFVPISSNAFMKVQYGSNVELCL